MCPHTCFEANWRGSPMRPRGPNVWCVFLPDALSAIFFRIISRRFNWIPVDFPIKFSKENVILQLLAENEDIEGAVDPCWAQDNIWLHSPGMPTNCMLFYIIGKSSIFQTKSNNQIACNANSVSGTAQVLVQWVSRHVICFKIGRGHIWA